jgi:hypothetical protein
MHGWGYFYAIILFDSAMLGLFFEDALVFAFALLFFLLCWEFGKEGRGGVMIS